MKLIYIVGLEHSGTTLTDHLLSRYEGALGLGEVANYFSPKHMENYFQRWGQFDDVRRCSCGKDWEDCEFWRDIPNLRGDLSNEDIIEKYRHLFRRICEFDPTIDIVVDSSKNLKTLLELDAHRETIGFSEIHAVMVVKDPRAFVASIRRKASGNGNLFDIIRWYRWWYAANQQILETLEERGRPWSLLTYERLCNDAEALTSEIVRSVERDREPVLRDHARTHVAMGNKNFVLRNSDRIAYDQAWFYDRTINFGFLTSPKLQRFIKSLDERCKRSR